jgi:hypothetical protein
MAGAASGLINTTRQLGAVIGSAAVGALLQNQLAVKLAEAAAAHAGQLPPQVVDRFSKTSGGSFEVGAGQNGVNLGGAAVPPAIRQAIADTFHEGFTNAMRVSLVLPIAVLAVAALSCLLLKGRGRTGTPAPGAADEAAAQPEASQRS